MSSVAIIGGGFSGITAAKSAIECGLRPTVFEKSSQIAGLWQPNSSAWDSLRTNLSHYTCMFSDFAWKTPSSDFPTAKEMFEYLTEYAKAFELQQYVSLNSEVQHVTPSSDKWLVQWSEKNEKEQKIFDFVIVASGFFTNPSTPSLLGKASFQRQIIHSKDYKNPHPFRDKTVVILGNSFSGCEIAAELADSAKQIVHLARRQIWVLPRSLPDPSSADRLIPGDLLYYRRSHYYQSLDTPPQELNVKRNTWFQTICQQKGSLAVTTDPHLPPYVAISDNYLQNVADGKIEVQNATIDHLEEGEIVLDSGERIKVDALICCTGYKTSLPFLDQQILDKLEFQPDNQFQPLLLHKTVFPRDTQGLAVVGIYFGPFIGAGELQARWACMVFSGKIPGPLPSEIARGIEQERQIRKKDPRPQYPHGDYVGLSEDLAAQIGVIPDFDKIKEENLDLHDKLINGPFSAASYRLTGFASKPELALELIEQVHARLSAPSSQHHAATDHDEGNPTN